MRIGINCGHTVSGTVGCGAVGDIDESVEAREVGYALENLLKVQVIRCMTAPTTMPTVSVKT